MAIMMNHFGGFHENLRPDGPSFIDFEGTETYYLDEQTWVVVDYGGVVTMVKNRDYSIELFIMSN